MGGISRRQLFRLRPATLVKALSVKEPAEKEITAFIRPPGALQDPKQFIKDCQVDCRLCADACPHEIISFLGPEEGLAEGTPVLSPKLNPCRWCEGFPCIKACPTGALQQHEAEAPEPIAKASVSFSSCSNSYGELCDTCVLSCPDSIRALKIVDRRVVLNEDSCIGCGLCAYYCSEHNDAIDIKPSS